MGIGRRREGENRGAARFGEAETRRRSLRLPPQAAGAAPRAALPSQARQYSSFNGFIIPQTGAAV